MIMARHTRYSMLVLIILLAKIAHCQQNAEPVVQYRDDCQNVEVPSDSIWSPQDILDAYFHQGYPYAQIDSKYNGGRDTLTHYVQCGPHFSSVLVKWTGSQTDENRLVPHGTRHYPWSEVLELRQEVLNNLANQGYPYARLLTNPRAIRQDTLVLELSLDTIRRIYIHEVELQGDFSMNPALFSTMTGIGSDQVFSLDRIEHSIEVIRQWDFAELQSLHYDFNPYGVKLLYEIAPSQPSRFDILIGLVPSNRPGKQYEITGNAYLDIRNQLKMGERIYLKFDKYANSSQAFDLRFDFPYLPLIRSGILAEGLIDRRDSTVLDAHGKIGLQYSWKPGMKYAFFLLRDQSRLISVHTGRLANTGLLPDELDYNFSATGLSITHHRLDHFINPRKGRIVQLSLTGGLRRLVRNAQIVGIELSGDRTSFQAQYDSLTQSTLKAEIDASWDQFIPVGNFSTLRLRSMASLSWASADLFQNEYRRLGGFQDIRGFPENSFFGDGYAVWTAEYRFLFGAESNAYVFGDFGLIHHPANTVSWNYPYSVGIGLNLGTKAGIFGISYAVGGQRHIPLALDQSRVNFGLIVNY